ncbi:Bug family tripartite tricarboxylate transporter substrate binding protein [Teichococcus aerofrigidensis]
MSMMRRRSLLAPVALALVGPPAARPTRAQSSGHAPWPQRPIRVTIAFPPGGPTDLVARVLGEHMTRTLGQPLVVENRPGANGNIGAEQVARAEPDGHSVLYNTSSIVLSTALYDKPGFALSDFAPVVLTASVPLVLAVNPALPAEDLAGFVALLRASPGRFAYGSSGNGNVTHLANFRILRAAGLQATHVPYRGSAPALTDAAGGQVQFVTDTLNSALPLIRDGRLRALAVTSPRRVPLLPEVPTLAEAGMPGLESGAWQGLLVPARTPAPVVARLNEAANLALADATVRERLAIQGAEILGGTPEAYGAWIREESARWGQVIAESGVKLD